LVNTGSVEVSTPQISTLFIAILHPSADWLVPEVWDAEGGFMPRGVMGQSLPASDRK